MLPLPLLPDLPDAACKGLDGEAWFADDQFTRARAAAVCRSCPERKPCLAWAAANRVEDGIWGGWSMSGRGPRRKKPAA